MKLNITAYHPQCDGMVERFNCTLKAMLRKRADQFGTQWDKSLSAILWAYRNTPHESAGEKNVFSTFWDGLPQSNRSSLVSPNTSYSNGPRGLQGRAYHVSVICTKDCCEEHLTSQAEVQNTMTSRPNHCRAALGTWF